MNLIIEFIINLGSILSGSDVAGINTETLGQTFTVMGQGMLGIFVVMILILISTVILNKVTAVGEKKSKNNNN